MQVLTIQLHFNGLFLEPSYLAMTDTHVVAASRQAIYVWQFATSKSLGLSHMITSTQRKDNREKCG